MRARHRHFNPAHAGASLVLDSRYINQADNTEVPSWPDRSANAYTVEQTISANRPTFQTNELNGNPVVRFDGSNDFLNGGDILDLGTNGLIMLCVGKITSGTTTAFCGKSRAAGTSGRYTLLRDSGTLIALYSPGTGVNRNATLSSDTSTDYRILSQRIQRGVSNKLFVNGAERAANTSLANDTANHNTSDEFFVGAYQSTTGTTPAQLFLNGDIAAIAVLIDSTQSISVQKRAEHAAAYSFKISCN